MMIDIIGPGAIRYDAQTPFDTACYAAALFACMSGNLAAENNPPPAGQMCPQGAYVIGFDRGGNIVCSNAAAGSAATQEAPQHAVG